MTNQAAGSGPTVVCLGETMALVAPDPPAPLAVADRFVLSHAGAESNVAATLARLGTRARWCSRLGDDPFGRRILADLGAIGVDTSLVRLGVQRTGVMFKDPDGASTTVRYYRDSSAASAMDDSDGERALAAAPDVVHLTGITPALSPSCAGMIEHVLQLASASATQVSFDVNHRPALWPDHATAAAVLLRLAQRSDIVLVGLDEAAVLWGTRTADDVRALLDQPQVLVVKDSDRSASSFEAGRRAEVPAPSVEVVEAVGAGDAFAGGWLHARLAGADAEDALRLGHQMAAASLSSPTDHPMAHRPAATR